MAVPIPTGRYTIRRPGTEQAPVTVDGHASYRGGADVRATDGRRQQVGAWTLLLDPEAWPVTEVCLVDEEGGTTYRVNSAALRGAGELAHVTVDADVTSADAGNELGVDEDGNVEEVPVHSDATAGRLGAAAYDGAVYG